MEMTDSYCIIEDNKKVQTVVSIRYLKAAVLINLYYEEQLEFYQCYLNEIPDFIDIYIISSNDTILNHFEANRYAKIKKENRGRDISALLVSAKNIVSRYKYICFIHDKKEKCPETKDYVKLWRKNLWDNMLQSQSYIYNLLELFESENRLGMLVPLPPHEGDRGVWLKGSWGDNLKNTKDLANDLNISADISKEKPPIAYSTVFWARSKALEKLFVKNWDYLDFPNEPMKDDGEINHAIERILQFVVEDAGYDVKVVMSSSFATRFINQLHDELADLWGKLDNTFGIRSYVGLDNYNDRIEKIKCFCKNNKEIYLYGAGQCGRDCLRFCKILDVLPKGIIVTDKNNKQDRLEGIPIISIADFKCERNVGILVTVGKLYQSDVINELKNRGVSNYIIF